MKNLSLFLFLLLSYSVQAQAVLDTVVMGAGYANQKWYSLQNDEQGSSPKNNWDLAFETSQFGAAIHINTPNACMAWTYPNADTSGWATIDTAGMSTWKACYNSDTSWSIGAFNSGSNAANQFDFGWGVYSLQTHAVTGDSLFVVKLSNGTFKKLWLKSFIGDFYNFTYADLNGSNEQTVSLSKSTYNTKNFVYYSLGTNTIVDREPATAAWDLTFVQYTTFVPTAYSVTGILSNNGVKVAQVNQVGNTNTFNDYQSQTYTTEINQIGYDWKFFDGSTFVITDSLVYFVKRSNGDVWKVIPTGFIGSSAGSFMFSKEKLNSTGIFDSKNQVQASLTVYPTVLHNQNATIAYDLQTKFNQVQIKIADITGRTISVEKLSGNTGFQTHQLNTSNLESGMYLVQLELDGSVLTQKIIIH